MKQSWMKLVTTVALAALLLFTLAQGTACAAEAATGYGRAIVDSVNVRRQPSLDSDAWFRIDTGYVCEVLGTRESGTWYKVRCEKPNSTSGNIYIGYVLAKNFHVMTDKEVKDWLKNPVQPSGDVVITGNVATGQLISSQVNVREKPSKKAPYMFKLDKGVVVQLLSIPAANDSDPWYKIKYNGYVGYIQGPYLKVISTGNLGAATPAPTAKPSTVTSGYVWTTMDKVLLWDAADGDKIGRIENKETVVPLVGAPEQKAGYTWFPVMYNNTRCYLRSNASAMLTAEQEKAYLAGRPIPGSSATVNPGVTAKPTTAPTVKPTEKPSGITSGYVWTTMGKVLVWDAPNGNKIGRIETKGTVVPLVGAPEKKGTYTWFPVMYGSTPCYLRSNASALLTDAQVQAYLAGLPIPDASATVNPGLTAKPTTKPTTAPTVKPTEKPSGTTSGYVWTTMGKVLLWDAPNGNKIGRIETKGTVVPLVGTPEKKGTYTWFPVMYGSTPCYLRSNASAQLTDAQVQAYLAGLPIPDASATVNPGLPSVPTTKPTTAPTAKPTEKPTVSPTMKPSTGYGYARTTMVKVRIWDAVNGKMIGRIEEKGTVVPMTGTAVYSGKYTWYPIQYGTTYGYLRSNSSEKLTAEQEKAYLAGLPIPDGSGSSSATPAPAVSSNYLITVLNDVNLRVSPSKSATSVAKFDAGKVFAYNSSTVSGDLGWYRVVHNNQNLWVLATSVRVMTKAEYEEYLANNPQNTPQVEVILGYVKTTVGGVNVRKEAKSSSAIWGRVNSGMVFGYSAAVQSGSYTYYLVRTSVGQGYIRSDVTVLCDANGVVNPTLTPNPGTPSDPTTTTYPTLRLGSTGADVTRLVTALKQKGYYVGDVIDSYTSAVRSAVIAFQQANGLEVDGIAGQKTQSALYGTTITEPGKLVVDGMTLYPAEKIDWYTGGIQQIWAKGASYKIYDVQTGIVWTARYYNGARHADVEPLTKADTAKLCRMYGVSKASDINSHDHWYRRPSLVTIGNRTFACSLYGVPHGNNDGAIKDNDLYGVLCIHFTNSEIHESGYVDTNHQKAIEYAYQHSPSGQK